MKKYLNVEGRKCKDEHTGNNKCKHEHIQVAKMQLNINIKTHNERVNWWLSQP